MASSISSLGLSGLPLTELLENLRTAEEAPLGILDDRKTSYETKISGYGIISSSLSSFQSALTTLKDASTFTAMKTTSSNTSALVAVAKNGGGAVAGQYSIEIGQLATTQSLVTNGVPDRAIAYGAGGTMSVTLGDGTVKTLELDATATSLNGLRDAINKSDLGVSATIINSGDSAAPFKLVLSAKTTGTDAAVSKIEVAGNASLQSLVGYEDGVVGNVTQSVQAKNAELSVNGIDIVSQKNTLDGAIDGLSFDLLTVTEADKPVVLKVEANRTVASQAVEAFVSAYNSLQSVLTQLTAYDSENNEASALTGDRVPRTVQAQIRGAMGSAVDNGGFATLSQIGVTTDPMTGLLKVDKEKLTKQLDENPDDVQNLFVGDNGLAKRLDKSVTDMLATGGLVKNATEGAKASVADIEKQYTRMETRIEDTMARYSAQFVALEKYMSQMNSISGYLTQQINVLNGSTNSK